MSAERAVMHWTCHRVRAAMVLVIAVGRRGLRREDGLALESVDERARWRKGAGAPKSGKRSVVSSAACSERASAHVVGKTVEADESADERSRSQEPVGETRDCSLG